MSANEKATFTKKEVKHLVEKHKGVFHGANAKLVSIEEDKFYKFLEEFGQRLISRERWDAVANEMGVPYAKKYNGERP